MPRVTGTLTQLAAGLPIVNAADVAGDATASVRGLATAAQITKLDGIAAGAQVNLAVGTTAGTVAAGNDSRLGTIQVSANGSTVAASGIDTSTQVRAASITDGTLSIPRGAPELWFLELSKPCVEAHDARIGVLATAGAIDLILDLSGNAATATAAAPNQPTVGVWASDGLAAIALNGTDQWLLSDGPLEHLNDVQSRTMIEYTRRSRVSGTNCMHGGLTGAGQASALQVDAGYGQFYSITTGGTKSVKTASVVFVTTRDQLAMWVHADGTGNASLWIDGNQYVVADAFSAGTTPSFEHLAIGALATGAATAASFTAGNVLWFGLFSGALGVADYKSACRGLFGHPYANIICDGNSLTQGATSTGGNTYPAYLAKAIGETAGKCAVTNLGVSSQTTPQMIADFAAQVVPLIRPGAHNIYVVWEVGNDILLNQATPAAAVATYWTLVDMAVAAGFDVLAVTCGPRGDFNGTGDSYKAPARLTEANALILAGAAAHGCFSVADVAAAEQLQSASNRHYRAADTVHYTNAGYAIVAQTVTKQLARRLAEV